MLEIDPSHRQQILFFFVFSIQVLLISFYFPRKMLSRISYVFDNYPPSDYPKLYPKPIEYCKRRRRIYRILNQIVLLFGVGLIVVGISNLGGWGRVIADWSIFFFMIQVFPLLFLDISFSRYFRLMRNATSRRTAALRTKRWSDVVPPKFLSLGLSVYIAFVLFVVYIDQFNYPWFGGYGNVGGVTVMNLLFGILIAWQIYGKKLNPHQTYEDQKTLLQVYARVMISVSVVGTIFLAIHIILSVLELRNLQPIIQSLYFQLIALISFQLYRIENLNFEIYRADPRVA